MKILTFSTLYPSSARPHHGVFVENRLSQLVASGEVAARVVAPVPWFPFSHAGFGSFSAFAQTPRREKRACLNVEHPRYVVLPKIGMKVAPDLLYIAMKKHISRLIEDGFDFDIIDAHYFYPDGVAAAKIGKYFSKPVVITARGTDINLIPQYSSPRRRIIWAANQAAGLISVSQALKDEMVTLGIEESKIRVLRNGVDLERFRPVDGSEIRGLANVGANVVASVGHLIPRKGHDLVIRAVATVPGIDLLIVGEGPDYRALRRLSNDLGIEERVHFLGAVPHERMCEVYSSVDALVLASSREGWANVLLEAMACGTPVAATNVWGAPEAVTTPEAGVLIKQRSPEGVASALMKLLNNLPSRQDTRAHAEKYSWEETTAGQLKLFNKILSRTQ